jgi:adenylate cyclase
LVREIEAELKSVSVTHLMRRELQRARGPAAGEGETFSLQQGVSEAASVIFLDLESSTEFAKRTDAQDLMSTLNQLMAELGEHLDRYGASVTAYLGDGFMALVRGKQHALGAVDAALDMSASVRDFNVPRELLGLRPMSVRVGVSTGEVFIGNVGTYRKMDFTAVGATVNLAARLQSEGNPGIPAISSHTQENIAEQFEFAQGSPRTVSLKGLGEQQVWDVTGRRAGRTRRRKTEPQ